MVICNSLQLLVLQLRTKALEQQLAEVKLKQQEELFAQEEAKARLYNNQIDHQLQTEQDLRAQLALYGDKFEQFQACICIRYFPSSKSVA